MGVSTFGMRGASISTHSIHNPYNGERKVQGLRRATSARKYQHPISSSAG